MAAAASLNQVKRGAHREGAQAQPLHRPASDYFWGQHPPSEGLLHARARTHISHGPFGPAQSDLGQSPLGPQAQLWAEGAWGPSVGLAQQLLAPRTTQERRGDEALPEGVGRFAPSASWGL